MITLYFLVDRNTSPHSVDFVATSPLEGRGIVFADQGFYRRTRRTPFHCVLLVLRLPSSIAGFAPLRRTLYRKRLMILVCSYGEAVTDIIRDHLIYSCGPSTSPHSVDFVATSPLEGRGIVFADQGLYRRARRTPLHCVLLVPRLTSSIAGFAPLRRTLYRKRLMILVCSESGHALSAG